MDKTALTENSHLFFFAYNYWSDFYLPQLKYDLTQVKKTKISKHSKS